MVTMEYNLHHLEVLDSARRSQSSLEVPEKVRLRGTLIEEEFNQNWHGVRAQGLFRLRKTASDCACLIHNPTGGIQ